MPQIADIGVCSDFTLISDAQKQTRFEMRRCLQRITLKIVAKNATNILQLQRKVLIFVAKNKTNGRLYISISELAELFLG